MKPQLYIATNGLSVWSSNDLGESLRRAQTSQGIYTGSHVWGLATHPTKPEVMVGTEGGLYRFDQTAATYTPLPSPMDGRQVTAIAYSPHDPNVILAGTQTAAIFRSEDNGRTWVDTQAAMRESVALRFHGGDGNNAVKVTTEPTSPDDPVKQWTRVCQIVFDPHDPDFVLACVEIDDAWVSRDAGRSWTRSNEGLRLGDVHGVAISHHDGRVLFATTAAGLQISRDDGKSWQFQELPSPWQYTRSICHRPDVTGVMFLTNGSGAPGWEGRVYRSRDFGATWEDVQLPGPVESSVYFLAFNPADPQLGFASSSLGQFFRTQDGGETWERLPKRLGEVRAIAWQPA